MSPKKTRHLGTCLSCAQEREIGAAQLCDPCYLRAWNRGTHRNYPACGAVPVPYRGRRKTRHTGRCLSCGYTHELGERGLCATCYGRARGQGLLAAYPACGRVPVPYVGHGHAAHPSVPPPTTDLSTLIPRYLLPWGAPQTQEWQRAVAYEQRRAAEWLVARQVAA